MRTSRVCLAAFLTWLVCFAPVIRGGTIIQSAYRTIQDEGVALAVRAVVNFTGAGVTCADNSGSGRTDCTIPGGVTSAYGTIQNNGSGLTARAILNFIGATCVDNPGSTRTDCTITTAVSSVFGQTGAVPNLSGDCTTSGSSVVTCTKTSGTSFGPLATLSAPTVSYAFPWGETCCTAPSAASFSWSANKQTSDTLQTGTDFEAIFQQRGNTSGVGGLRFRHAALPATPYTVTGCFMQNPGSITNNGGLEIDDGTKVQMAGASNNTNDTFFVADYATTAASAARLSFSPQNIFGNIGGITCMRLTDNGTNRIWYFSGDYMRTWSSQTNLAATHTTTLTATNAGFGIASTDGNYQGAITLIHYRVDNTFFVSPNNF